MSCYLQGVVAVVAHDVLLDVSHHPPPDKLLAYQATCAMYSRMADLVTLLDDGLLQLSRNQHSRRGGRDVNKHGIFVNLELNNTETAAGLQFLNVWALCLCFTELMSWKRGS